MTIQECYQRMGGGYEQAVKRLSGEKMVERFIAKFLDDDSFSQLCKAMEENKRVEAFCAAHTLRGVSGNLSFIRLFDSASALTETLQVESETIPNAAEGPMEEVRKTYQSTVEAIRTYFKDSASV